MKCILPLFAVLVVTFATNPAMAQSQADQQACEGDVYDLCSDKIPDQDKIVACLRRQWRKVSKECRGVMASYGKNRNKEKRENASDPAKGTGSAY